MKTYVLSRVGYVTRQITSRRIEYSEFIPLALTFTQFTITPQLLPSAVSQLLLLLPFTPANAKLQLTGYSGYFDEYSCYVASALTTQKTFT
jgi:hypothetical protein